MSEYNKNFQIDGEHVYRDLVLAAYCPKHNIQEIEKHVFDDNDVIIATYPKCGKSAYAKI